MIKISFFAISFLLPLIAISQQQKMHINITGLRNNNGKVLISIYNSQTGFPDVVERAVIKDQVSVKNKSAEFVYEFKKGDYAIAVLHDENSNMKMDTKAFGLPKEGYGFSNNVMGIMGPPSFKKAAIHFPSESEVNIRMKY